MARSDSNDGFVRFLGGTILIGLIGYGGGWFYTNFFSSNLLLQQKQQELAQAHADLEEIKKRSANQAMMIDQLGVDLEESQREAARLDTSMKLLKTNYRVGFVEVTRQDVNPHSGAVTTEFRFMETDAQGQPMGAPRTFRVEGEVVYFDYWVVKFDDVLVEQGDTAGSLCLFRRLYGEFQEPNDGYTLDESNTRPAAYGEGPISEYEREIWNNFWAIANDEQLAAEMGVRAAHGEAVSMQLKMGMKYQLLLRASDGLTIRPLPNHSPQPAA